jgi:preprotein translocase subunit YajC
MFVTPAYAQAAGVGGAGVITQIIPFILIFAIMYFLLIRPQQKKQKQHAAMIEALRRGDEIVTQGGIVAKVSKVLGEGRLQVEISPGVKVRIIQATVAHVLNKTEPANDN